MIWKIGKILIVLIGGATIITILHEIAGIHKIMKQLSFRQRLLLGISYAVYGAIVYAVL